MGKKRITKAGLTAAQEKFCQAYAMKGNGVEAYRAAYPKSRQSKDGTVAAMASKLLKIANVKQRISQLADRVEQIANDKFDINAERVLQEIAAIAFANSDDYFEWGTLKVPVLNKKTGEQRTDQDGEPLFEIAPFAVIKPSSGLSRVQKAAIVGAEMTFSKDGTPMVAVKMADKLGALKALGQHLKVFNDKAGADVHVGKGATVVLNVSQAEANL